MEAKDFLLEIGVEEVPARLIKDVAGALGSALKRLFEQSGLGHGEIKPFFTPRRIAVYVHDLEARQKTEETIVYGPYVHLAYDEAGSPTKALLGFAKSCGVSVEETFRVLTKKGEVVAAKKTVGGKETKALLADALPQIITHLDIPGSMYWHKRLGPFIRPVHWLLCLFGSEIVEFECFGLKSGRKTRGHRFKANEWFELDSPHEYAALLKELYVIADPQERASLIVEQMRTLEARQGFKFVYNPKLLEEVSNLVEYPILLVGNIQKDFMTLPREVLIEAMASHQRYFAVEDGEGKLLPFFGFVSNTPVEDESVVIRGNERVLSARLFDAKYFYESDLKVPIEVMASRLKGRVFLHGAGDMLAKSERIRDIGSRLAKECAEDYKVVERAGFLCKADLVSQMVGEFPELQGVMGYYYALAWGEDQATALAIREHYKPASVEDSLPSTVCGAIVSVADKVDTVACAFAMGVEPTGSKDPLGIRRCALGILKILTEQRWGEKLSLGWLLRIAFDRLSQDCRCDASIYARICDFFRERMHSLLVLEHNVPTDFANAVVYAKAFLERSPRESLLWALALKDFSVSKQDFALFLETVYKRALNILRQANEKEPGWEEKARMLNLLDRTKDFSSDFAEPQAIALERARLDCEKGAIQKREYLEVLASLYGLKDCLAAFFGSGKDGVPVLVEPDPEKRLERLALVARVFALFDDVADFSRISTR